MCQRSVFARSCIRIAEEIQLQAEEEWILDTLKKIKQQRNGLQIERLHLENMKLQLNNSVRRKDESVASSEQENSKESSNPVPRRTELMSAVDMMTLGSLRHTDEMDIINDDAQCNNEELNLNLNLSNPFAARTPYVAPPFSRNDYGSDEDSGSEVSDGDDMQIDINMLMNGVASEVCNLQDM